MTIQQKAKTIEKLHGQLADLVVKHKINPARIPNLQDDTERVYELGILFKEDPYFMEKYFKEAKERYEKMIKYISDKYEKKELLN